MTENQSGDVEFNIWFMVGSCFRLLTALRPRPALPANKVKLRFLENELDVKVGKNLAKIRVMIPSHYPLFFIDLEQNA